MDEDRYDNLKALTNQIKWIFTTEERYNSDQEPSNIADIANRIAMSFEDIADGISGRTGATFTDEGGGTYGNIIEGFIGIAVGLRRNADATESLASGIEVGLESVADAINNLAESNRKET